tara:strand:+ start:193 stop:387 length:195 start_codon:yes stop_codon:yes gene_type:complete
MSSDLKPFITDITVIKIEIPRIIAIEDKKVEIEIALSFLKLKIYDNDSLIKIFLIIKFFQITYG